MENVPRIITALKAVKKNRVERVNIYLDSHLAFSLESEVVLKENLKVGQALSGTQINKLTGQDSDLRCLNAAYQFLTARPRSRSEVSRRLMERGFGESEIERTLAKLEQLHLVDDAAFAEYWKDNRTAFRPRSRRFLKQELNQKGVDAETIKEAVGDLDEGQAAYQAALAKSQRLAAGDYNEFKKKIGGFLLRRGFGYGVVKSTLRRLWKEKTGDAEVPPDTEE